MFDCEWNAFELRDITTVHCMVMADLQTGELHEYGPTDIERGIEKLKGATRLLGHNIIAADLAVLEKLYNFKPRLDQIIIDTLLLSRLSFPDRVRPVGLKGDIGPHSLEAWAVRLGGEQKVHHEDWSKFSPEMLERCKADVRINVAVYAALYKEMAQ